MSPIRAVPPHIDLPALEQRVLERWRATEVFQRSLARTASGEPYVVYEGPPTANGHPGAHHVEARVFKDLFPRYQTMRGRSVPRRGGWDCHGLPVELAVEKELGFTGKGDIEAYGVAAFNERCRESVLRHVDEFERLTERMGFWVDLGDAYRTMDTSYIESVWWSLAQLHRSGLLEEDFRVTPYCPRCQTGLSDHEVAQGYAEVVDPSVYFRVHLLDGPLHDRLVDLVGEQPADLLVWTTQPWTAYVNTAVAVHPEVDYVAVRASTGDVLVVAEQLVEHAVGAGATELARVHGIELEGSAYAPLYPVPGLPEERRVLLADYVTTDAGTGVVGQSPAFGAEDMASARRYGLPVVNPVGRDGRFYAELPLVGGVGVKAADRLVIDDLATRGQLWREEAYPHQYPLCWRCDTALLYYALPSWYVRTTARREDLLAQNAQTDWHPATIRDGRYGEWLRGNVDWALSRSRYWGTPLPLWRCATDPAHVTAVESLAHLSQLSGSDQSGLDPHRPYVDAVTFACPVEVDGPECGAVASRVPEVIDGWYDSGAMPFAQLGYPHLPGSAEAFAAAHPADMICEALDQTRGWFYTLMAVGTLVQGVSPYRTVLCLGIILDETGRKMSKHLGNVLDPFELFDRHGADAVRWLMLAGGNPWQPRRVGHEAVAEVVRTVLLTYWNTVSFFTTYAAAAGWEPVAAADPPADHPMDLWVLERLGATTEAVTAALDAYDPPGAGRALTRFLDDLSNWYVRRSRRRFWDGDAAALRTLHGVLMTLTQLLAPFTPFLTDEVWSVLRSSASEADGGEADGGEGDGGEDSVHLSRWPAADPGRAVLSEPMQRVRDLVELGRSARAGSGVKTRQPLPRALVSGADGVAPALLRELAGELNVIAVELLAAAGELVDVQVRPAFRALGKRFGARTKEVAAQVSADAYRDGQVLVLLDGEPHTLSGDELLVTEVPRQGWAVAASEGLSVALDLTVTPQLRRAGLLRDAVRLVQDSRKAAGLQVSDRIELWWQSPDGASEEGEQSELARTLLEGAATLAQEVLAVRVERGTPAVDLAPRADPVSGLTVWLRAAGE